MKYTEEQLKEALKDGKLFAMAVRTIKTDGITVDWIKGNKYEVVDEDWDSDGEYYSILVESNRTRCGAMEIHKEDKDFKLVIKS